MKNEVNFSNRNKKYTNTNYMSSNMQLEFVCEYCKKEFTAKKLTLNEASALLQISPLTCRRWIKDGKIISARIGKKHIFKHSYINELVNKKSEQKNNE